jgi:hypothetical protein
MDVDDLGAVAQRAQLIYEPSISSARRAATHGRSRVTWQAHLAGPRDLMLFARPQPAGSDDREGAIGRRGEAALAIADLRPDEDDRPSRTRDLASQLQGWHRWSEELDADTRRARQQAVRDREEGGRRQHVVERGGKQPAVYSAVCIRGRRFAETVGHVALAG